MGLWNFGFCTLYLVPDRREVTIFPIIDRHINTNAFLISDDFSVYVNNRRIPRISRITQRMPQKKFIHRWVNHSLNFVDPLDNNIHTNTIERVWRDLQPKIKSKKSLDHIYNYLNDICFFVFFQ